MTETTQANEATEGQSRLTEVLDAPLAYLDEHGGIVIVGFEAWNRVSFVDCYRAIPDSWRRLVIAAPNAEITGRTLAQKEADGA